ncbi:hypothetical protein AGMMS49574_28020 [Bacteroidia bacterium]|nr:hypothetical protein AGMMS49574_28020 [Bacteroidia bacterium]
MGFFNSTKKNAQVSPQEEANKNESAQVQVSPLLSPSPVPIPVQAVVEETKKKAKLLPWKEKKEEFRGFFKINIYSIFKYNPVLTGEKEKVMGKWVETYSLLLDEPELASFQQVKILKYENGHYDLVFSSTQQAISSELKEFINFSVEQLGPDFMHKGEFTDADANDIALGAFSRIWYNKLRIDNVYFTPSLTLYDITPE